MSSESAAIPRVILTVGLPGSGKSTYLSRIGVNAISSDAVRLQLVDDATDQTIHSRVFAAMRYLLRQRLELRRPATYIDATNLTPPDRKPFIDVARRSECRIDAIFFDIPLDICKGRNAARARLVPPHVLDQMAAKLVPPSVEEGFTRVEVFRYLPETLPVASAG
jgi:predicted kinase